MFLKAQYNFNEVALFLKPLKMYILKGLNLTEIKLHSLSATVYGTYLLCKFRIYISWIHYGAHNGIPIKPCIMQ